MKRVAWLLLVIVAMGSGLGEPAEAQAGGPTMVLTAGFDGYCRRYGDGSGWCAIRAVLSNEGTDVEGELRIAIESTSVDTAPDVVARQVVLPAHSRKAYFLYLPSAGSSARSRLTAQLVAGDEVLAAEQTTVTWLGEQDRLYVVASSAPSAFSFLSDVAPPGGRAVVARLDLETLAPDATGWEGLDVLILNDLDTAGLSPQQRRALETWVTHGGHLIVGGGTGTARTAAGVADLLPVAVSGVRAVDGLRALGERWNAPTASGPYPVADTVLRDGEALIEQEDEQGRLILLARRTWGRGAVSFLAFDAGLNPFTRWDDHARLWEFIFEAQRVNLPGFTVRDWYRARDAVNAIPGLRMPSMLHLLAFMLLYTLLVGPLNYVVLRKLDRRELAWLTIPALVVGFTVLAYVTGFQVRGSTPIVHRLAVVYVPEGARVARVSEVVGLFSPRRTTYDLWVGGAGARQMPGADYGTGIGQSLHVVQEAQGFTVTGLRVDVGGIQPLVTEGYVDVPAMETDLQLAADASGRLRLEGSVRNGALALKEAVLIVGDVEQRLGDLDSGEQVGVSLTLERGGVTGSTGGGVVGGGGSAIVPTPPPVPYSAGADIWQRILGPGDYWTDLTLFRRYQLLQAVLVYNAPYGLWSSAYGGGGSETGLEPGAHLVGWAEEDFPLPAEVVGRPFSTAGTALYVYDLPVARPEQSTPFVIPPGLMERQVVEATGLSMWPGGFHMEPGAQIVFRFTTWRGVAVRQVDEVVLGLQGSSPGSASRAPAAWLWNWESGDWESLDVGWGQHSWPIPHPERYVLLPGTVLLRLETEAEWPAEVESLTITIKGQR